MAKQQQGLRKPRGHSTAMVVVRKCPQCGRRVELKAMSVGLTITKRYCGCMLRPRDFIALMGAK